MSRAFPEEFRRDVVAVARRRRTVPSKRWNAWSLQDSLRSSESTEKCAFTRPLRLDATPSNSARQPNVARLGASLGSPKTKRCTAQDVEHPYKSARVLNTGVC